MILLDLITNSVLLSLMCLKTLLHPNHGKKNWLTLQLHPHQTHVKRK